MMDDVDQAILRELQLHARLSNVELARRVHLSPPAVHARVKRLEDSGLIERHVTMLNRQRAGFDMLCFVGVRLQFHETKQVAGFHDSIAKMPEVLECHHVTGEYDYLLKVIARNTEDLEDFLLRRLTPVPGVAHIQTSLVLREVKATSAIPIP